MPKNDFLFQLKDIGFSYTLGQHQIEAIKNLTLNIPKESLITFSGPSGSGKSTLLNILGLIEPIQQGELIFQNENVSRMKPKRLNEIRKYKIGFIFQQFHLIPVFTAEENVAYFLARQGLNSSEIKELVEESLAAVGLWIHRQKKPGELSGGQRQRVAIARAIAKKPEVIIADEPTASLDQNTAKEIMEIFEKLVKVNKSSVILTTHDPMIQAYANYHFQIIDGLLI